MMTGRVLRFSGMVFEGDGLKLGCEVMSSDERMTWSNGCWMVDCMSERGYECTME